MCKISTNKLKHKRTTIGLFKKLMYYGWPFMVNLVAILFGLFCWIRTIWSMSWHSLYHNKSTFVHVQMRYNKSWILQINFFVRWKSHDSNVKISTFSVVSLPIIIMILGELHARNSSGYKPLPPSNAPTCSSCSINSVSSSGSWIASFYFPLPASLTSTTLMSQWLLGSQSKLMITRKHKINDPVV